MIENSLVVLKKKSLYDIIFELILKVILIFSLIILVLCLVIIIQKIIWPTKVPNIFGVKPFIVLTGSMEPSIKSGDIVFVKETEEEKIKVGDIIAFKYTEEDIVTLHRVVEIDKINDTSIYRTKGDNNQEEDRLNVKYEQIEGIFNMNIAKIGNIAMAIRTPLGRICSLCFVLIIFLVFQLLKIRKSKKDISRKLKETQEVIREIKEGVF